MRRIALKKHLEFAPMGVDGAHVARTTVGVLLDGDWEEPIGPETLAMRFRAAHEAIAKAGVDGGATATLVLLRPHGVLVGWVGNAEARLLRRGGPLHTLTIPHEFGVHRAETRRLIAAGAEIVDPRALSEVCDVENPLHEWRRRRGYLRVGRTTLEVTRLSATRSWNPSSSMTRSATR
jgi:hypothetical protein